MKNLFTVIVSFSNHTIAIKQYEEKTPLEALTMFIRHSDRLDGYDREKIEESLGTLHHSTTERGVWTFAFKDRGSPLIGGTIIQTDKGAYLRPHHH